MYVKHLFSAKGQEKQDPFPSQKGQKDHRSRWPHQYNQFLVIWKSLPVPTDGRSPGSQILTYRRLPNFHQWPHLALAIYSLFTVTRSHRFCTCFPFNLRPQDLSPAPGASAPAVCLIQLCFYFNLFHGAVSIVSSRPPSFRAPPGAGRQFGAKTAVSPLRESRFAAFHFKSVKQKRNLDISPVIDEMISIISA